MSENLSLKNVAKSSFNETLIEDGFLVLTHQNNHYCLKGTSAFIFNNGNYTLNIAEETSLLLYNPQRDLPIHLETHPKSWLVSILISIKKFHSLFSQEASYITFLSDDNKDKKYYKDGKISPSMAITLNQILNYNLNSSIKNLYFKGKAYEPVFGRRV